MNFNTMPVVCYYHSNCLDGFTSAWIVKHLHPHAELIPVGYEDDTLALPTESLIYIVDFTFPDVEFMKMLIDNNTAVLHLDHHEGAEGTIESLKAYDKEDRYTVVFDKERSGAGITWDTFHPGKERPHLVNFVEDRDLWRFHYDETRFFTEGLITQPMTIEAWDWAQTKEGAKWLIDQGQEVYEQRVERCISQIEATGKSFVLEHDGVEWDAHFSHLAEPKDASEQTNLIVKNTDHKVALAVTVLEDGRWKVRVTTAPDGPNANAIAKAFHPDGGGHPHAAGFVVDKDALGL